MENVIKKLRKSTNKSQSEFASTYNIPLSTLKKWEQNESKPAPYVLSLLTSAVDIEKSLVEISDADRTYYYDPNTQTVYNKKGDSVRIYYDLFPIKQKQNLLMILDSLFEDYEKVRRSFIRDIQFYRNEENVWRKVL